MSVTEPPRRAPLYLHLARFVAAGGASVGTDIAILFLLHSVFGVRLLVATTIAYAASLVINYSLNHNWVFEAQGNLHRRMIKYVMLVAINYGSTIGFVAGLTAAGVYYLLAKFVALAVNAVLNFTSYRYWVFR